MFRFCFNAGLCSAMAFFKVGKPSGATMHSSSAIGTHGMFVIIKHWHWYHLSSRLAVGHGFKLNKTITLTLTSMCVKFESANGCCLKIGTIDQFHWSHLVQVSWFCLDFVTISSTYIMSNNNVCSNVLRKPQNNILRASYAGVQNFFSGPIAGLTNQPPVQDFRPSAPLNSSSVIFHTV